MDRSGQIANILNTYHNISNAATKYKPLGGLIDAFDFDGNTLQIDERYRLVETFKDKLIRIMTDDNDITVRCIMLHVLERMCVAFPVSFALVIPIIRTQLQQSAKKAHRSVKIAYTCITVLSNLYPRILRYLVDHPHEESMWKEVLLMKSMLISGQDDANDAWNSDIVRSACIYFMEVVITSHTVPMGVIEEDQVFLLGSVPSNHSCLQRETLADEARTLMDKLKRIIVNISLKKWTTTNLGVATLSLARICTKRTQFMSPIVKTFNEMRQSYTSSSLINPRQLLRLNHILKTALISLLPLPACTPKIIEDIKNTLRPMGNDVLSEGLHALPRQSVKHVITEETSGGPRKRARVETTLPPALLQVFQLFRNIPLPTLVDFIIKCLLKSSLEGSNTSSMIADANTTDKELVLSSTFLEFIARFRPDEELAGAASKVRPTTKMKSVPAVPIPTLKPEQCRALGRIAYQRLMSKETSDAVDSAGFQDFREQLLGKLSCCLCGSEFTAMSMLNYILENVDDHYGMCISWLYNLWACQENEWDNVKGFQSFNYDTALEKLIPSLVITGPKILPKLVLDLPRVTDFVYDIINTVCYRDDETLRDIALSCFTVLVLNRKIVREKCWNRLLELSFDERVNVRLKTIRVLVDTFLNIGLFRERLIEHAKTLARALIDAQWVDPIPEIDVIIPDEEDDDEVEKKGKEEMEQPILQEGLSMAEHVAYEREKVRQQAAYEEAVRIKKRNRIERLEREKEERVQYRTKHREDFSRRHLDLFFQVGVQYCDIFSDLDGNYAKYDQNGQQAVHKLIPDAIGLIERDNTSLLKVIRNLSCQPVALHFVHELVSKRPTDIDADIIPNDELVATCKYKYKNSQDARFLIFVLKGLRPPDILSIVPQICALTADAQRLDAFERLIPPKPQHPLVDPWQLYANALRLQYERANLRHQVKFVDEIFRLICTNTEKPINQLTRAFNAIVQDTTIPVLFLRSLIMATRKYPRGLTRFSGDVLRRLIKRRVWDDALLWEGFGKYCEEFRSYDVLVALPPDKLDVLLKKHVNIIEPLLLYTIKYQTSIPSTIHSVLADNKSLINK